MLRNLTSPFSRCRGYTLRGIAYSRPQVSVAWMLRQKPTDAAHAQLLGLDEVVINGYIQSIRNQKQRSFAAIGDGSSMQTLQALLTPEQAKGVSYGNAVRVTGSWKPSVNPLIQSHELHVSKLDLIGPTNTLPSPKKNIKPPNICEPSHTFELAFHLMRPCFGFDRMLSQSSQRHSRK